MRYVPLGALHPSPTVVHTARAPALTFFGQIDKRNSTHTRATRARWGFWRMLREEVRAAAAAAASSSSALAAGPHDRDEERLQHVYSAWDDGAFGALIGGPRAASIFLNLHKGCGDPHNPLTFRVQKLLSARALLLSETAYEKDMAEFEGLVDFFPLQMHQRRKVARAKVARVEFERHEVANFARGYLRLAAMSAAQRQALAEARHRMFAARFAPAAVFARAGIYELFDRVVSAQNA